MEKFGGRRLPKGWVEDGLELGSQRGERNARKLFIIQRDFLCCLRVTSEKLSLLCPVQGGLWTLLSCQDHWVKVWFAGMLQLTHEGEFVQWETQDEVVLTTFTHFSVVGVMNNNICEIGARCTIQINGMLNSILTTDIKSS